MNRFTSIFTKSRPDLGEYLIRATGKRRNRESRKGKRGTICNRVMIVQRPESINHREELGHWEADMILSKKSKSVLVVVRERKLLLMFIRKVPKKTAYNVQMKIVQMLKRIRSDLVLSITLR